MTQAQYLRRQRALEDRNIRKYRRLFREALSKQIEAVVQSIDIMPNPSSLESAIPSMISDNAIAEVFNALYLDLVPAFANWEYGIIADNQPKKKRDVITGGLGQEVEYIWNQAAIDFVAVEVGSRITSITQTSRSEAQRIVSNIVKEAVDKGLSIPDTMKLLEERLPIQWRKGSKFRAELIARTEVLTARAYGSHKATEQAINDFDLKLRKKWVAKVDSRTRPDHIEMNGKEVEYSGSYQIPGGPQMKYPHDPAGGAAQVCNCRCTQIKIRDDGSPLFGPPL